MKKAVLSLIFSLILSTLGLVYIDYNKPSSTNIPQKETNIPKLSYPSSLVEINPEILLKSVKSLKSYRQPPSPANKAYQLLNQNNIDHLLPNIDKATFKTKYMKKGVYLLVDKTTQKPLLEITIGNTVKTLENSCTIVANSPTWRETLNVNRLRSCTHQWLIEKKTQPYPSLLKEFTHLLSEAKISNSENLSAKWQCQEMVYIFGEYISTVYPLSILLSTQNSNLCSNNQYLLRSIYTTAAHSTKGQPSDFESIYDLCVESQLLDNTTPIALNNCKSALARSIAHYYYANPSKAISICALIPAFQETNVAYQCPSLIYNEYFSQIRLISTKVLSQSNNKSLKEHINYINELTPEKICIQDNLSGCWEASMIFIDKNYEISIPRYLKTCASISHSDKETCELGVYYLLGKLNNEFTNDAIQKICSTTSNPKICLNKVQTINKNINREKPNQDL